MGAIAVTLQDLSDILDSAGEKGVDDMSVDRVGEAAVEEAVEVEADGTITAAACTSMADMG